MRVRQIWSALYIAGVQSFDTVTSLGKNLRGELQEKAPPKDCRLHNAKPLKMALLNGF